MKNWIKRHAVLTREEHLLISGILIILLCGLGVRQCNKSAKMESGTDQALEMAE